MSHHRESSFPASAELIELLRSHGDEVAFRRGDQLLSFRRLAGRAQAIADSLILAGLPVSSRVAVALPQGTLVEFVTTTAIVASGNVVVTLASDEHIPATQPSRLSQCGAVIYTANDRGLSQQFDNLVARIEVDEEGFVVASFDGANDRAPAPAGTLCTWNKHDNENSIHRSALNAAASWLVAQLNIQQPDSLYAPVAAQNILRWIALYSVYRKGCTLVETTTTDSPTEQPLANRIAAPPHADVLFAATRQSLEKSQSVVSKQRACCLLQTMDSKPKNWSTRVTAAEPNQLIVRGTEEHGVFLYHDQQTADHDGDWTYLGHLIPTIEHRFEEVSSANPNGYVRGVLSLRDRANDSWSPVFDDEVFRKGSAYFWRPSEQRTSTG